MLTDKRRTQTFNEKPLKALEVNAELKKSKPIESVGKKETWMDRMSKFSLFAMGFGVYVYNSTKVVHPSAIFFSAIVMLFTLGIINYKLRKLGSVLFCCSTTYLSSDDPLMNNYSFVIPTGPESYVGQQYNSTMN